MSFQMYIPTRILFGEGQLSSLHEQKLPGTKAMIVISNGKSTKENGALNKTEQELKNAGVDTVLFDKIMANLMSDMYALTAIENIGAYLARAVRDGSDMEAREHVDFANTLSGVVMTLAKNARATMGGLFFCDRVLISDEECVSIFKKSYC